MHRKRPQKNWPITSNWRKLTHIYNLSGALINLDLNGRKSSRKSGLQPAEAFLNVVSMFPHRNEFNVGKQSAINSTNLLPGLRGLYVNWSLTAFSPNKPLPAAMTLLCWRHRNRK